MEQVRPPSSTSYTEHESQSATEDEGESQFFVTPRQATENIKETLGLEESQKLTLERVLNEPDPHPILILKMRPTWNPPPNVQPDHILDDIATWRMPPNQRRDAWNGAQNWLFHFARSDDIVRCKNHILEKHPYTFGLSDDAINMGCGPPGNVFADAIIVQKWVTGHIDAFPYPFFMRC